MGDLSQLPEVIIHDILGYLENTEQPRVSIFCKTWYSAWITYPILKFRTPKKQNPEDKIKFLNFIDKTLQRYQEKSIHIEELTLSLNIKRYGPYGSSRPVAPPVRNWIRIAVQNGVKNLHLSFGKHWKYYELRNSIFEGNSLRELKLVVKGNAEVMMMKQVDDKVMFNHLQTLYLKRITIHDDMFEGIIASCPLIEKLSLWYCEGLEKIKVTKVNIFEFSALDDKYIDVEIEAPNLQYLDCSIYNGSLKICQTDMLKYLKLVGSMDLSSTFLDNWEHKFPQVEDLILSKLKDHTIINLSSHSLKNVDIESDVLRKLHINAPNLVSLKLYDILDLSLHNAPDMVSVKLYDILNLSLSNAPSQWGLFISTPAPRFVEPIDTDLFCRLKRLLTNAIHSEITLDFGAYHQSCEIIDVGRIPTSPIVEVEKLILWFCLTKELVQSNFLEALFLTCHPKTIEVTDNRDLVGYLSKKLIERRKHETKSWSQELKEVQLEIYDVKKQQWKLISEWRSLTKKKKPWAPIRFRLEWEAK